MSYLFVYCLTHSIKATVRILTPPLRLLQERLLYTLIVILLSMLCSMGCTSSGKKGETNLNGAFRKEKEATSPTLNRIIESGELIITTLSGPDTYYEYHGRQLGLQYALASDFARSLGVSVRVEVAKDTTDLLLKVKQREVDMAAIQVPLSLIAMRHLSAAAIHNDSTAWVCCQEAHDLQMALNEWLQRGAEAKVEKEVKQQIRQRFTVRRQVRAPFISREKGIISTYDPLFKEAAHTVGWDWRLIAAQCYQESGFDPNAVSWAGAKGLMQIMPSTAETLALPVERIFVPADNVAAASRLLRRLQHTWKDIPHPAERIKFVLAAYNGGTGHIRDAQTLTRKYGGDPQQWDDVSRYVLGLSTPRYYTDPVVKCGYMIGSETVQYVYSILQRWAQYGGAMAACRPPTPLQNEGSHPASSPNGSASRPFHPANHYSRKQHILSPEELQHAR